MKILNRPLACNLPPEQEAQIGVEDISDMSVEITIT